jgi:hypothetical protein
LWLGTFVSVVLLDVDLGLFIGIILTLLLIAVKDHNYEVRKLIKYTAFEYVDEDLIKINVNFKNQNLFI